MGSRLHIKRTHWLSEEVESSAMQKRVLMI